MPVGEIFISYKLVGFSEISPPQLPSQLFTKFNLMLFISLLCFYLFLL